MNLILLFPEDRIVGPDPAATPRYVLRDFRAEHVRSVLRAMPGDVLSVGVLDDARGTGRIESIDAGGVELAVTLDNAPPSPWIDLVVAMPRPKAWKRLLPQLSQFAVDRVFVVNAARTEKPYFSTQYLEPAHYRPLLHEGLMQARRVREPRIHVEPLFRPFVEDRLDLALGDSLRLTLDPAGATPLARMLAATDESNAAGRSPAAARGRVVVAIGPDRGFVPFEIDLLAARGFRGVTLGDATLRTDTAAVAALGALTALTSSTAVDEGNDA